MGDQDDQRRDDGREGEESDGHLLSWLSSTPNWLSLLVKGYYSWV